MTKAHERKISLIIPVYNVRKYLGKCLESAVCQTYQNYEVIVIDDGSTDGSAKICRDYERRYSCISCIYKTENEGLAAAWQSGLQRASGDYTAFLDGDDWLEEDYLEQLVKGIEDGADIVCCNRWLEYGEYRIFQKEILTAGEYRYREIREKVYPVMINDGTYLGRGVSPNRWGKLFRTDILKDNLPYCDKKISFGEDLNIVFPVMLDCRCMVILNDRKGLYHYRQNQVSIARSYKKNMFGQIERLHEKMLEIQDAKAEYDFSGQIDADYLCLFLEYIKNETKAARRQDAVKNVIHAYQKLKDKSEDIRIQMKFSDRLLLYFLKRNWQVGIYFWFWLYSLTKGHMKKVDWKFLRSKKIKGDDRIRVLMVGPDRSVRGGMSTVVDQLLQWNDWDQTKIIYIPSFIEKKFFYKIAFYAVHYFKIMFTCLTGRIDIVHLHVSERGSFFRKAFILLSCKKMGIRTILHHHGAEFLEFYENSNVRRKQWIKKVVHAADMNIVLSRYQKERMEQRFPDSVFEVVYNSVEGYSQNNFDPYSSGILFAGRFGKRKGIYDLLEAVKKCNPTLDRNVKLYLCGDGEVEEVKKKIKELGLGHRIAHIGWCSREQLEAFYKKTMLYVLPSRNEGLPMALLEAMSYGIPCISTRVDAIPEVIQNAYNGILITPGDVEALENALMRLAQDSRLRKEMSENSYQVICDRFLISDRVKELENLYIKMKRKS